MHKLRITGYYLPGKILVTVIVLLFLFVCCSQQVKKEDEKDYEKLYKTSLKRWTETKKVYSDLNTGFVAHVTFKNLPYRIAYRNLYAYIYQISDKQLQEICENEVCLAEKYVEFVFALYTSDEKHNDLNMQNSIWKLYLSNNLDERLQPFDIAPLKKTAIMQNFYPYVNTWTKVYRVRFLNKSLQSEELPFLREGVTRVKLILTGVQGEADFIWDISPEDYQKPQ